MFNMNTYLDEDGEKLILVFGPMVQWEENFQIFYSGSCGVNDIGDEHSRVGLRRDEWEVFTHTEHLRKYGISDIFIDY